MSITVKDLFKTIDCTIIGNANEPVEGLAYRSDAVQPGDAFFCIVGLTVDGHTFAQDAIDHGAKVLVVERKLYLADATDVTLVVVADSRKAMAASSAVFYNNPSTAFDLVGITGTNGKTTTTYLVEHIARTAEKATGIIGTVGITINGKHEQAERTTPESSDLQAIFARMRDAGCEVVTMEVSSHALDLLRTWDTLFAVTAFSNLTQDHLDYHKTFDAYFEAKAQLFSSNYPALRAICIDDEWGEELLSRCAQAGDTVISCGFNPAAQIHPISVDYAYAHTTISLDVRGHTYSFTYPLAGRFNVSNIMLAFAIGLGLGIDAETIVRALESAPAVPGRMQQVSATPNGIAAYVDYAHTPDALKKAIGAVKSLVSGRTIVVFGCGGDRDATKRPIMGKAALAADYAIVTSDNPRTEDPLAIIDAIVAGMVEGQGRFEVEPDRRCAIAKAVAMARPNDCILVAGKGHEDYQILGTETIHFSDTEVVAEELDKAGK